MIRRMLHFRKPHNRGVIEAIHSEIVSAARQPILYAEWQVPDTPIGRYEMLCLHMILFLQRAGKAGETVAQLGQDLTDEFFKDVDHSLRELGIGDMGVPKRMKKLARMFYGRAESYGRALAEGDTEGLALALKRNVLPESDVWHEALELSAYAMAAHDMLDRFDDRELLIGQMCFPRPLSEVSIWYRH